MNPYKVTYTLHTFQDFLPWITIFALSVAGIWEDRLPPEGDRRYFNPTKNNLNGKKAYKYPGKQLTGI